MWFADVALSEPTLLTARQTAAHNSRLFNKALLTAQQVQNQVAAHNKALSKCVTPPRRWRTSPARVV
jgi:hypothetical protein